MTGPADEPERAGRVWRNWAGNQACHPARVVAPRDPDELGRAVKAAVGAGLRVRAVGAGHSFTGAALTDGVQIDTTGLSGLIAADAGTGLVTLLAGTRLRDIPGLLAPHALAMQNLGDIDSQSIAGAISTGTHGTGARFGGLATQVRGLTLVTPDGSLVECSPQAHPELFEAARLGLGAFGVLATVTLRCVPAFALDAVEAPMPMADVLEGFDELFTGIDHVEFHWFPHTDRALTKRNTRLPPGTPTHPLRRGRAWLDDELLSNIVYAGTCRLCARVPALIPATNRLATRLLSARHYSDAAHRVFTSPRRVRFRELEYALPRAAIVDVLRELRELIERRGWRISFPVEVRVAAADDVWLSTAHGRDTAYVAVHQYHRTDPGPYFTAVEELMVSAAGRPHWGKMHTRRAADLAASYPRWADVQRVRARADPENRFGNAYVDDVLGRPGAGGHELGGDR